MDIAGSRKSRRINESVFVSGTPEDDKVRHVLGVTQLALGNAREAVACFQKTWDDGAETSPVWLAMAHVADGHIYECKKFIPTLLKERLKQRASADVLVMYSLAAKPFDTNLFLKTIEGMTDEQILKRNDSDIGLYIRSLWTANQADRARAIVANSIDQKRDLIDSLLVASEWAKQVTDNYETNSALWRSNELIIAAIAYADNGDLEKAKACYSSYLISRPDQPRALRGLGAILFHENKIQDAKALWKKAWALGNVEALKAMLLHV